MADDGAGERVSTIDRKSMTERKNRRGGNKIDESDGMGWVGLSRRQKADVGVISAWILTLSVDVPLPLQFWGRRR